MALGMNTPKIETDQYNGRMTSLVILSCMVVSVGGFLFGYDDGIQVQEWKEQQSNTWMLFFDRVLLGLGVRFVSQAVPMYLSEMAPPNNRGAFIIGFRFTQSIGSILANLINFVSRKIKGGHSWRLPLSIAAVPASFLMIGAFFLPETASGIIQRGLNPQTSIGVLQRIRGTTELNDIVIASTQHSMYRAIGQRKYRPQLIMATSISFFSQMTGFNLVASYAPLLLQKALQIEESVSILMHGVVLGLLSSCANIVAAAAVDRLGRRALFMIEGAMMLVSQVMIGGAILALNLDEGRWYVYIVLATICVHVIGFELSWGPLGCVVPSEIFPLEVRSAGQSIFVGVSFLTASVVAQKFQGMFCVFEAGIFFFFTLWIAVMTVFLHFMLPETKKVPVEQMEVVWRAHWFWKRVSADDASGAVQN